MQVHQATFSLSTRARGSIEVSDRVAEIIKTSTIPACALASC